jgi:hypothetical protein
MIVDRSVALPRSACGVTRQNPSTINSQQLTLTILWLMFFFSLIVPFFLTVLPALESKRLRNAQANITA